MNAPETLSAALPAAGESGLVAWPLIRTLVAFDTTSRGSNLALIDWVTGYLKSHGVESTLTFSDDKRKANLAKDSRLAQIQKIANVEMMPTPQLRDFENKHLLSSPGQEDLRAHRVVIADLIADGEILAWQARQSRVEFSSVGLWQLEQWV